jgi:hypothetical protein
MGRHKSGKRIAKLAKLDAPGKTDSRSGRQAR